MILIDANDEKVDWVNIVANTLYWRIAIGSLVLDFCDQMTISDEDVGLLLQKALLLVSDREKYRDLAKKNKVPFVLVGVEDIDIILERIDNARRAADITDCDL